jgi:zinc protease
VHVEPHATVVGNAAARRLRRARGDLGRAEGAHGRSLAPGGGGGRRVPSCALSAARTHCEVLPNGLTLLLRESHLAPVAELQIWANVGSADELPGEEGLAHFHEHMLFKGTQRRGVGDVAAEIEGAGGRVNAYTSFDTTVYHATLPSDALETGLDVLVDAVRNSVFDPDEIEREIEVVLEEIRRSLDSPLHVLGDAVFAAVFQVHPYRAPILGSAESVARFRRDQVLSFFRRWYAPDNLVVVAAGDFDAAALAESIRGAFAGAEPAGARRSRPVEPPQRELRTAILQQPFERVRLDLSWPAAPFRSDDAIHLDLLSYILGECESSRLVRRVKEREGLADRIDSGAYTPLDAGLFSVSVDLDSERALPAISASLREVERLRLEAASDEEIERARANFLCAEHFERESVSGQARKLGSFQVLAGDWRKEEAYLESVRRASPADLLRVARHYLAPEQLTVGALLPGDGGAALSRDAVARAVAAGVEATRRALAVPARATGSARGESPAPRPPARGGRRDAAELQSYRLEGGAELHVAPRREVPVVALRAGLVGGLLSETPGSAGITNLLTGVWMRGTETRSAADLARAVEGLAADLDGFAGRSSLGLTLEATSDKLEPGLDLLAEVLLEPGFDPEEIEHERRDILAAIDRREDRLAQLAYLLFARTLFGEHPYALPVLGNRESVEGLDEAALRAHHDRLVRAPNLVIGMAGDVDPDRAAQALSSRLSALPAEALALPGRPALTPPAERRTAFLRKDRAQAHLVLGFAGLAVQDRDRCALDVIAQLLAGQGGRLFLELRDRRGLAYSVSATNIEGLDPGFFSVYIATAPEKSEDARAGILEELERLVSQPVPDDELARARRFLAGNFAIDQQRSASRAAHLALDALYGLGPDHHRRYAEEIAAVTKEDVLRVARRVLRLDAYTLATVAPTG